MKHFCLKQEIAFVVDNNQLWIKMNENEKYLLSSGMGNAAAHLLVFCTQALAGQKGNLFLWSEIPREGQTNTHISEGSLLLLPVGVHRLLFSRFTRVIPIARTQSRLRPAWVFCAQPCSGNCSARRWSLFQSLSTNFLLIRPIMAVSWSKPEPIQCTGPQCNWTA